MRTVVIVMFLLLPVFAFAEIPFDGYAFNGYMWEEFGKDESLANLRMSLLTGFLNGFDHGYRTGWVKGAGAAAGKMLGELRDLQTTPKQRKTLQAMVSKADSRSWLSLKKDMVDDLRIRIGPKEKVEEYIKDVDKFLKTYPLCRKHDIFYILDELVRVWDQTHTYKDIGEKCSEY